jgi:hypothetical protein
VDGDSLVVVAKCRTAAEAHVIQGWLESEGIEAAVGSEQANVMFGAMIEEAEVLVRAADADRARERIRQHGEAEREIAEDE